MAESRYSIFLNNDQLKKDAKQASEMLKGIGDSAVSEGARIDNAFKKAASAVGVSLAGISVGSFVQKMFQVRSEFQDTESSMRVFLGSAEKASDFMKKLQDYAWYNMFEFSDLTQESTKLLAFGNDVNSIIPILDKLSNIAAGTKKPLSDFVDLYNKAKNVGKIDAMGLQSWASKGIVITDVLKQMGIEVDNSAIKFEHLEKVLDKVTGTGGMFNDLMKEQMNNLSASYGQLQDDIAIMFNEIGKKTEGVMKGAIDIADSFVQNYEKVGKTILEIATTYGVYRASIIAVTIVMKEQAAINAMVAASNGVFNKSLAFQWLWTERLQKAHALLNKTMLKNPAVIIGASVAGLTFGIYKLVTAETAAEAAQRKHNEALEAAKEKKDALISRTQQLIDKINDETQLIYVQIKAWKELQKEMPEKFGKMSFQEGKSIGSEGLLSMASKATEEREIANLNKALGDAEKRVDSLKKRIKDGADSPALIIAVNRQLQYEQKTLELLKGQKKEQDEIIRQAEFEAKPNAEKLTILERQKQELINQKEEIKKLIPESERVADTMNKTVTPSILSMEKGFFEVNTEWSKFDWQTLANIANLKKVQEEINNIDASINAISEIDKSDITYAQAKANASKAYTEAKQLIDDITKNAQEYSQEAYEKAVEDLEAKKKVYQALGGNTTKQSTSQTKQADYTEQIKREAQALMRIYQDLEFDVEQARIQAMNDGVEKILAQNQLNYDKEIEQIKRHQEGLLEQLQESEKTKWLALNSQKTENDWNKSEEKTKALLSDDQIKQFNDLSDAALKKFEIANKKTIDDIVKQYQTYAEQRLEIEKKFNEDLTTLQDKNADGRHDLNIEELKRQMTEALASLDNEFSRTTTAIEKLFSDMSRKSVAEMREIAAYAQEMMDFIIVGNWDSDRASLFGIKTEEQFKQLNAEWSKSPEKLAAIKKAVRDLNNEADRSEKVFGKMSAGLKQIFDAGKNGGNLRGGLDLLSEGLRDVTTMGDMFADSLRNIGELANSNIFSSVADGLSQVMNVADSTMQGAQAGAAFGPVGAAIGGGLGLVSSITKVFSDNKKHRDALKKQIADNQIQAYLGELEINRLYRERYEWIQKIGETTLLYIARQGEELKRQTLANAKDQEALWEKLISTQYKSNEKFKKTGLFGLGKGKTVTEWADLARKTWEEIEVLAAQGKLSEEGQKYYEALKKAKEEGDDLAKRQEEYLEKVRETFTGSTYDSVVTGIIDGFKAGKRSAADFADTFKNLMTNAVASALQFSLEDDVREWYEQFAEMSKKGLTEKDIQILQNSWDNIIDRAAKRAEDLEAVTGTKLGDSTRQASQKGFASMSQDSAEELNGRFTAIQAHTYSITENTKILVANSSRILQLLSGIESNTEFCRRLDGMDTDLRSIKNGIDDMNLKGLKLKTQ